MVAMVDNRLHQRVEEIRGSKRSRRSVSSSDEEESRDGRSDGLKRDSTGRVVMANGSAARKRQRSTGSTQATESANRQMGVPPGSGLALRVRSYISVQSLPNSTDCIPLPCMQNLPCLDSIGSPKYPGRLPEQIYISQFDLFHDRSFLLILILILILIRNWSDFSRSYLRQRSYFYSVDFRNGNRSIFNLLRYRGDMHWLKLYLSTYRSDLHICAKFCYFCSLSISPPYRRLIPPFPVRLYLRTICRIDIIPSPSCFTSHSFCF